MQIVHTETARTLMPNSVSELLDLLWRLIYLLTGLFTNNCSLAIQLKDLHRTLQQRQQRIMGKPKGEAELLPQLTWAIIATTREFFVTLRKRKDIDPDDDGEPRIVIAELSIYTSMLKAGLQLNLPDMPEQWQRKSAPKGDAPKGSGARGNGTGTQRGGGTERRHGGNPFQPGAHPTQQAAIGDNPKTPAAFNGNDLKELKNKISRLTLSQIALEAGIRGGPSRLNITGWPARTCLNWVCMGACRRQGCGNEHPATVDDTTSANVYKQLDPGIRKLLQGN